MPISDLTAVGFATRCMHTNIVTRSDWTSSERRLQVFSRNSPKFPTLQVYKIFLPASVIVFCAWPGIAISTRTCGGCGYYTSMKLIRAVTPTLKDFHQSYLARAILAQRKTLVSQIEEGRRERMWSPSSMIPLQFVVRLHGIFLLRGHPRSPSQVMRL